MFASILEKIGNAFFNLAIQKYFLIIAFCIGFLYLIFIPPFQNVDESHHYYRIIGIANGAKIEESGGTVGAYLPEKYKKYGVSYDYLIKNIDAKISFVKKGVENQDSNLIFVPYANTALYAPLTYLPCLPVAFISSFVDLSPSTLFYLMRFSNLLAYIGLGYLVLRVLPCLQLPMMILLLLPMSLSIGASVTSDVVLLGVNFLWFAYIVKFLYFKNKISKKEIVLLFLLAGMIGLCKNYFMTVFLSLLLPIGIFSSKLRYWLFNVCVILFSLLCSFLWANNVKDLVVPLNELANPFAQVGYIFDNFLLYLCILIKSLIIKLPRIIITMVGVLGWQDTRLDFVTYAIYPLIFYISTKCSCVDLKLSKFKKAFLILLFGVGVFLVSTYMYISWSALGSNIILGLNGKYFIPLMPVVILILAVNLKCVSVKLSEVFCKKIIYVSILCCLISSLFSVLHRFYGLTPNLYYSV